MYFFIWRVYGFKNSIGISVIAEFLMPLPFQFKVIVYQKLLTETFI